MTTDSLEERVSRIISAQQAWVLEQLGSIEPTPAPISETSITLLNLHELALCRQTLQRCIDVLNQHAERALALRQTQTEILARLDATERIQRAQIRNQIIIVTVILFLVVLLIIVIGGQFSIMQRLAAALGVF